MIAQPTGEYRSRIPVMVVVAVIAMLKAGVLELRRELWSDSDG